MHISCNTKSVLTKQVMKLLKCNLSDGRLTLCVITECIGYLKLEKSYKHIYGQAIPTKHAHGCMYK
jgi:hypothetical protein